MPGSSRSARTTPPRKTQGSDPRQAYLEIVNAWQLGRRELAILRELAAWRQQEAVRRDLALNFVVEELHLFKVAERRPTSLRDLNELGLAPIEIKIHGKRMLDIVASAQQSDPDSWPEPIRRLVDFPQYKAELKRIKAMVEEKAKASNIPLSWSRARNHSPVLHLELADERRGAGTCRQAHAAARLAS